MLKKPPRKNKQGHFLRLTFGKIVLTILFLVIVVVSFQCQIMDAPHPRHCFASTVVALPFYLILPLFSILFPLGVWGIDIFLGWLLSIFFYYMLASALVVLWKKMRGR